MKKTDCSVEREEMRQYLEWVQFTLAEEAAAKKR